MDTIKAFERKMREANFASLDEARSSLKAHPLSAEYTLALLVERGVLAVTEDGAVIPGRGPDPLVVPKRGSLAKTPLGPDDWKPEWPQKDLLMSYLDGGYEGPSVKFKWVQKMLASRGQPHSHWITLHAIWHLMKQGWAEKDGNGYKLTELGSDHATSYPEIASEPAGYSMEDVKAFRATLKEMGDECINLLEETIKEVPKNCTAKVFSSEFGQYTGSQDWVSRDDFRAGFSLPFVRWLYAEYESKGSLT